jgi:outer membrane receptor protein involved in Fe transport
MVKVQASATGPWRSTTAVSVQFIGRRTALDGSGVDAVALTHLTAGLPVRPGLRLSATVRNLFNLDYADPGSAEHLQRVIPQDGRTLIVGLEWHGPR